MWLVSSCVYANATTNGKRAMRSVNAVVSQNEIAGFPFHTAQPVSLLSSHNRCTVSQWVLPGKGVVNIG